jgi:hypothetical protein
MNPPEAFAGCRWQTGSKYRRIKNEYQYSTFVAVEAVTPNPAASTVEDD